ncbi:MAG: hypothetical protein IKK43_05330 [Clostridia bacterium]|nr:hypothetical protein [Clostridia bacterium]
MKKNKIKIIYFLMMTFSILLSLYTTVYAGNVAVEGKGTQNNPYVLNFNYATTTQGGSGKYIEIDFKNKEDFWFKIDESNGIGTYGVEHDKNAEKVRITYINGNREIYYPRNGGEGFYVQAGAIAIPDGTAIEPEKKDCKFSIYAEEKPTGSTVKWKFNEFQEGKRNKENTHILKNTFRPNSGNLYVQDLNYFVFAKCKGTVKEFYEETSKKICDNSEYEHIRYADGIADFVIDSNVPRWAQLRKILNPNFNYNNYPTEVIRFGTYSGAKTESNIKEQEKHTVEIKYHFVNNEIEPEEQAGVIEMAITKLLNGIGSVFMAVVKAFLGDDLSMDALIFNRYKMTIIDFRGRMGVFAYKEVSEIINYMYSGFERVAIVINIVILLYLGIQIVINVGGQKQAKYIKNLQNWVVGVILLFLLPKFFPFITDISNVIVGYIGSSVTPYVTQYNIASILRDDSLLGEDADTKMLDEKIKAGIEVRENDKTQALTEIAALEDELNVRHNIIMNYAEHIHNLIDDMYDGWVAEGKYTQEEAERKKSEAKAKLDLKKDINAITSYVETLRASWTPANEVEFENRIDSFKDKWALFLDVAKRPNCSPPGCAKMPTGEYTYIMQHSDACKETTVYPVRESLAFINEYREKQLKCGKLESEINTLNSYSETKDLMSEMKVKAGKTGRLAYILVWYILFFQLFTLVGLYYKRIIMVAILIMIFPIVMITYAIDKIGDGSAQTFETWAKEFILNITVQIAHAVVYVTLIQTGLSFYEANPKNWLFFIIAVLCLFPVERLLRSIFGMNGSTISSLNANVAGGFAAGLMIGRAAFKGGKLAAKGVKSTKSLVKNIKSDGFKTAVGGRKQHLKKTMGEKWQKFGDKEYKAKDAKARKRQAVADRQKRTRDTNIQRRQQQMKNAGAAKKAWLKTVNAASMVRNGMYHAGNVGRKIKGISRDPGLRNAGKAFKLLARNARKFAGLSFGVMSGATNAIVAAGKGNMINGIAQGAAVGSGVKKLVGGTSKKPQEKKQQKPNAALPSAKKTQNMPGGQKYKKAPKPVQQRVNKKATNDGKMAKTKIKGTKTLHKTTRRKTVIREENDNH